MHKIAMETRPKRPVKRVDYRVLDVGYLNVLEF